jgi:radical SAM superfamily enzyme YgiQ (UPF0313 family)
MKINYLIINAPNVPRSDSSILIEPVDALTLATWIQHNQNDVDFIDFDRFGIGAINNLKFNHYKIAIVVFDYLIPLHSSNAILSFNNLFRRISKLADYILLAGRLASYFPKEILNQFPALYGCLSGEPEIALVDLFKYKNLISLEKNGCVITQKNKFDNLKSFSRATAENIYDLMPQSGPIANRKLCQFNNYIDVHSIISSRGCNGCCKFCSTNNYLGPWRAAFPQLVLAEIKHLVSLGAYKIIFLDDDFSSDRLRVEQICESIKRNHINIIWGCLCRIVDVDENLLKKMYESGCRWTHFGMEHGDYNIRLNLGKNFSNDYAIKIIKFAQNIGVRVRTSWILDLPEATSASVKKTFNLAKEISSFEIKLHFLALRPGSKYYGDQLESIKFSNKIPVSETYIHQGYSHNCSSEELRLDIIKQLNSFRKEMKELNYQWAPNIKFWKKFNDRPALPDEKFLSASIMRYGLGWKK